MNRHPATLVQISPLQLRQGLFFSLALLLTLIAGQLHHNWQVVQDAQKVAARATLVVKAPLPTPTKLMHFGPAAASTALVNTATPRDRWVF
ncbi:hypothetical protein [Pseudomonas sp. GZD-222]|uniref:hypothetical protein n=1 Tax=Pseudomonas sp. GZD-222 TaxID=3404805 RepID=UPI003BB7A67F